jgi:DNA primase
VVFTFDGDAAGQKAAMRAFDEDQQFVAQTFVAVALEGMDPCELRQRRGDAAVRELVESRRRMFEFAIRTTLAGHDLDSVEGQVEALRRAAPVVARIRDRTSRPEYTRRLAGWLGMRERVVWEAVDAEVRALGRRAPSGPSPPGSSRPGASRPGAQRPGPQRPDPASRRPDAPGTAAVKVERAALECILQVPHLLPPEDVEALSENAFLVPELREVHRAVREAGGVEEGAALAASAWIEEILARVPEGMTRVVNSLAVTPLPTADDEEGLSRYAVGVLLNVLQADLARQIEMLLGRTQRLPPEDPGYGEAYTRMFEAEARRRAVLDRMHPTG